MLEYRVYRESTREETTRTKTLRGESAQARMSSKEFTAFTSMVGLDEPAVKRRRGTQEELTTVGNASATLKAIRKVLVGFRKWGGVADDGRPPPSEMAEGIFKKLQVGLAISE